MHNDTLVIHITHKHSRNGDYMWIVVGVFDLTWLTTTIPATKIGCEHDYSNECMWYVHGTKRSARMNIFCVDLFLFCLFRFFSLFVYIYQCLSCQCISITCIQNCCLYISLISCHPLVRCGYMYSYCVKWDFF